MPKLEGRDRPVWNFAIDRDAKAVLEFMQENISANKLIKRIGKASHDSEALVG